MKDRGPARELMRRAAAAGYEALVFTTDANVFGSREWDRRNYRAPGRPTLRSGLDVLRHPRWLRGLLTHGVPRFRNLESYLPPESMSAVGGSTIVPQLFDASISWQDLQWIREAWRGKLLVKGVLDVRDAERAVSLGSWITASPRSRCCRRWCAPSARALRSSSTVVFAVAPTW